MLKYRHREQRSDKLTNLSVVKQRTSVLQQKKSDMLKYRHREQRSDKLTNLSAVKQRTSVLQQ